MAAAAAANSSTVCRGERYFEIMLPTEPMSAKSAAVSGAVRKLCIIKFAAEKPSTSAQTNRNTNIRRLNSSDSDSRKKMIAALSSAAAGSAAKKLSAESRLRRASASDATHSSRAAAVMTASGWRLSAAWNAADAPVFFSTCSASFCGCLPKDSYA